MPGTGPAGAPAAPSAGDGNYMRFMDAAEDTAREAGGIIMDAIQRNLNQPQVKSGVDLVTEIDKAAEKFIIEKLQMNYPDHKFLGEESAFADEGAELTDEPTWIVDPLDGTTNFVHGYPFVCVSIALAVNRVPVAGVVYNPVLNEMYAACQGRGAYLNDRPIEVRRAAGLSDALVVNNIGASREGEFVDRTLGRLGALLRSNVQAVRMSGSAAQNMCHVACGKVDCYFEDGYGGPWDVAAGAIIVQEAKGVVRDIHGGEFRLAMGQGKIVCGHESLVGEVCKTIRQADGVTSQTTGG